MYILIKMKTTAINVYFHFPFFSRIYWSGYFTTAL